MHVLIVDDQPDVVFGIQKGVDWKALGVKRIFTANSVSIAEKLLLANPIAILLCDIEMPPRSGLELLAFIREHKLNPLCIFLTSHAEFTYAQEALRLDAFDYVVQPAPYHLIQESVARAIAEISKQQKSRTSTQFFYETSDDFNDNAPADHIAAVIDYIHTNIGNDLNRQEIAESVHLNPEYLSRLFKKEMNLSLNQFIIREKVKLASAMLQETTIPISLIAMKVGFSNFSYFSQVFKRQTGMAPLDFRKQHDEPGTII